MTPTQWVPTEVPSPAHFWALLSSRGGAVSFRTTSGSALELAGDLQTASTNESETYRNGPLCSAPLFDIQHLEVYAFTG